VNQAEHQSFSDEPLLLNSGDTGVVKLMRVVRAVTIEFFDATLKGGGQKTVLARSNSDLVLEALAPPRDR
jgi:hypothetical protein